MKLIARTSFHQGIVILQKRVHCTPMKKVKVKKWWSKWAYGWNFMGYLLAKGDFLKAVNLQKFHPFFSYSENSCVQRVPCSILFIPVPNFREIYSSNFLRRPKNLKKLFNFTM